MGRCVSTNITVIRGDTLELYFELDIDNAAISNVYFTSKKAGLQVQLVYSDLQSGWCMRVPSEITKTLHPVIANYDLIIELINGEVITAVHGGFFAVWDRQNKITEDTDNEQE